LSILDGNQDEAELWRGQDKIYGKDVTVGANLSWESFTSVSTEESVAKSFAKGAEADQPGVLFKITGVSGAVGACLQTLSEFPSESEILLPPGSSFTVTKDTQEQGYRLLELSFMGVHISTLQSGLAFKSPVETVPGHSLCPDCAWQSLGKALRPEKNGKDALSLVINHPDTLGPRVNDKVPNARGPPLWVAARNHRNVKLLQRLIDLGADLSGVDTMGSTALHMAAFYGHADGVKTLLEADSHRAKTSLMMDKHNHTPVDMGQRYPDVVAVFKEYGITVEGVDASRPPSPLSASRCATPDISARDVCGMIGLMPTPRSYGAALWDQRVATPTSP